MMRGEGGKDLGSSIVSDIYAEEENDFDCTNTDILQQLRERKAQCQRMSKDVYFAR
jgi:hypothetical protein